MTLYFRLLRIILSSLLRSRLTSLDSVMTRFKVWPTDLDLFGHMTNSRYFSFMDLGRTDMMARAGMLGRLREHGWYPVVVEEVMQFRRSLNLFEDFQLETRVMGYDDRYFFMRQTFTVGDKIAAVGVVKARFLSTNRERISPAQVMKLGPKSESEEIRVLEASPPITDLLEDDAFLPAAL